MRLRTHGRTFLASGAILGLLGAIIVLLPLGPGRAEAERLPTACDRFVNEITALGATAELLDFYALSIGCNQDAGGVYVPDVVNGCAQTAHLLFVTGSDVQYIHDTLTAHGECIHYEDGSYGPVNPATQTP